MKYEMNCIDCGKTFDENKKIFRCVCGGKLDISINLKDIEMDKKKLIGKRNLPIIIKYFDFFPLLKREKLVHLHEGNTPLIKSTRLSELLGIELYLKNETVNPTGSFKDRPIVVGFNKAIEFGAKLVATASSGNAAASLAAVAAKAGVKCVAFVPEDIPESKCAQLQFYDAKVYRVVKKDKEDATVRILEKICSDNENIVPVPSFGTINPYQIEGAKSIAYEIAEEITPAHVIVPVGGGGLFLGNWKGFLEFKKLGIIDDMPKIHAVQPLGCAPLVRAFENNEDIKTWENMNTVAKGLADQHTWDGQMVLRALKECGGNALGVDDVEILKAQKMLAKYEGIFAEPSGSASLAGIMRMADDGMIDKKEMVVCEVTGSGFKDLSIIERYFKKAPLIDEKNYVEVYQHL